MNSMYEAMHKALLVREPEPSKVLFVEESKPMLLEAICAITEQKWDNDSLREQYIQWRLNPKPFPKYRARKLCPICFDPECPCGDWGY